MQFLRSLFRRFEVNGAVLYSVLLRCWQVGAGGISFLMIAFYLTDLQQGFYTTFWSLVALQTFVELGLSIVVTSASSHEWANLRLDDRGRITGDEGAHSRLVSLGRLVFCWYGVASALFVVVLIPFGLQFMAQDPAADSVEWRAQWIAVVGLTGLLLWGLPFTSMLEGCGQVETVNRYRFLQAVAANIAVWISMGLDFGLWAAPASAAARFAVEVALFVRYRSFFRLFPKRLSGERLNWRDEIWPMQWRLGLGGIFSYFAFFLFTPVMFNYHGAAVAGQMGMTRTLMVAVQAAALAWVQTRVPEFGVLITNRDFDTLDRRFKRLTLISMGAITIGAFLFWLAVWIMNEFLPKLGDRVLDSTSTALLALALVAYQLPQCQILYLRAHKREPLLIMNLVSSIAFGLSIWFFGRHYGPVGASAAYLGVIVLLIVPWQHRLWRHYRCVWHAEPS